MVAAPKLVTMVMLIGTITVSLVFADASGIDTAVCGAAVTTGRSPHRITETTINVTLSD